MKTIMLSIKMEDSQSIKVKSEVSEIINHKDYYEK